MDAAGRLQRAQQRIDAVSQALKGHGITGASVLHYPSAPREATVSLAAATDGTAERERLVTALSRSGYRIRGTAIADMPAGALRAVVGIRL